MKEYIKSRITMTLEILVLISVSLMLTKATNVDTSFASTFNNSIGKNVGQTTIQVSQDILYKKDIYTPLYTFKGDLK